MAELPPSEPVERRTEQPGAWHRAEQVVVTSKRLQGVAGIDPLEGLVTT